MVARWRVIRPIFVTTSRVAQRSTSTDVRSTRVVESGRASESARASSRLSSS
jgi:hypothetical protein